MTLVAVLPDKVDKVATVVPFPCEAGCGIVRHQAARSAVLSLPSTSKLLVVVVVHVFPRKASSDHHPSPLCDAGGVAIIIERVGGIDSCNESPVLSSTDFIGRRGGACEIREVPLIAGGWIERIDGTVRRIDRCGYRGRALFW